MTQFLKIPVSNLDNNWAERSLRTIILQRKNSLFFKTINSAEIHSGLYSIVKTCSENEINAFKYLNWLQEQSSKAKKRPANYTPFAYARYMNNTELIETAA
ncbi:IS66 family transposase [Candidatus Tisiphia endosymbiont of Parasteatoda lunata]|uniref:IS66 family transposase n=1 Tax=Candidatus Tisiphia endosymbiont of Parasteatoda lunata TaxID=3066275 RepID=UPI00313C4982